MNIIAIIFLGMLSGYIGARAMNAFMQEISNRFSQRLDMPTALGSYFTGQIEGAKSLGIRIHCVAGTLFGVIYLLILDAMKMLVFPHAILLGIAFGFFHGMMTSYILMFYASERHPIEQYRNATLEEGLLHLIGHVIYGAVCGLLGGVVMSLLALFG